MFRRLIPFTGEGKRNALNRRAEDGGRTMIRKIFAVLLLSLALNACEPAANDNNANVNGPAKTNSNNQASPAVATPQPTPSVKTELKVGDKVKVARNGASVDATVVAIDEKAGKATVRVQGEEKDTTVNLNTVTKP
jgi:transcription antitermination factor NusG